MVRSDDDMDSLSGYCAPQSLISILTIHRMEVKRLKKDEISYDYLLKHFYKLPIEAVMKKRVWDLPILERKAPIEDVFSILSSRRHVWIVEDKKSLKLVGVITEKDLLELLVPQRIPPYSIGSISIKSMPFKNAQKAEDIMTSRLVTIEIHHPVEEALTKMHRYRCYRLPVVEKGRLVGEVTIRLLVIQFLKVIRWHRILKKEEEKK